MEYQHRLEQANESVNHILAEELENADKKRKFIPSKTAVHESKSDSNEMDQDLADSDPQGVGGSSSSIGAAPLSTETRLQKGRGGRRRTNFHTHLIKESSSSVSANAIENVPANSGLQRPQEDDADVEELPPARKARLEALCSLVHGDHGQQE